MNEYRSPRFLGAGALEEMNRRMFSALGIFPFLRVLPPPAATMRSAHEAFAQNLLRLCTVYADCSGNMLKKFFLNKNAEPYLIIPRKENYFHVVNVVHNLRPHWVHASRFCDDCYHNSRIKWFEEALGRQGCYNDLHFDALNEDDWGMCNNTLVAESDKVFEYLESCCDAVPGDETKSAALHRAYLAELHMALTKYQDLSYDMKNRYRRENNKSVPNSDRSFDVFALETYKEIIEKENLQTLLPRLPQDSPSDLLRLLYQSFCDQMDGRLRRLTSQEWSPTASRYARLSSSREH